VMLLLKEREGGNTGGEQGSVILLGEKEET